MGIQYPGKISVLLEMDVGTDDHHECLGRLGRVSGHTQGVDGAARLEEIAASGWGLIRIAGLVPFARQRPQMHGTDVVVGG